MPRSGLNREKILAQAAVIADEGGLDALTLAAVAKRLGVTLPGLYKHVASSDAVHRDLAVQGVRDLTSALALATAGLAGRDALQSLAHAYRAYAKVHPGLAAASVRAPDPQDTEHIQVGQAAVATLGAALRDYRLDEAALVDAIRSLRIVLHGVVELEAGGGFGLAQSVDDTVTRLIDGLDAAFRAWGRSARSAH
jgi:AcrR family transcriptional regulator